MIEDLIKYVYILDIKKIEKSIDDLWHEYQKILDNPNVTWEEVNKARAILYFLGHIFAEEIAVESLKRRIIFIKPKISLIDFLMAIDSGNNKILDKYGRNKKFQMLKTFYLAVKNIKMKIRRKEDALYLDEERFNEKYKKLKPKNYF